MMQFFKIILRDAVIGINKGDILAVTLRHTMISRSRYALILLDNIAEAQVCPGCFFADYCGIVRTAIIDQQHLKICI